MRTASAIAFDLDDTLAPSKSDITSGIAAALVRLATLVPVCIISGASFEQYQRQVLRYLPHSSDGLEGLHLLPTCGTQYYRFGQSGWTLIYEQRLSPEEKEDALRALEMSARKLGLWTAEQEVWGERLEDRGSQVTYSALGQSAPREIKRLWDPEGARRELLRAEVQASVPHLEVRAGGSTSIDVTRRGIDKAYGLSRFIDVSGADARRVLFVGDRLEPGGNDYPVIALGVQTIPVRDHDETAKLIPRLVEALQRG